MQDLGQDLQQTLQKAIDRDMVTQGDAAMEHYKVAVQHLNAAQQAVTTVAMPLEIAERHLQAFKAAVLQKELDATGSSPNPGKKAIRMILFENRNERVGDRSMDEGTVVHSKLLLFSPQGVVSEQRPFHGEPRDVFLCAFGGQLFMCVSLKAFLRRLAMAQEARRCVKC